MLLKSPVVEVVDMLEDVVVDNCLTDIVDEMEVTTEVDVDTVTVCDSETIDLEVVILKLKSFFFLLIEDSSDAVEVEAMLVEALSVVVVDALLSELNLTASNQDMSLPLLFE